ncbi:MAG TPA: NAD(P)/FAD-dependent oxidoreductase [Chthoniobacterales bacterium]
MVIIGGGFGGLSAAKVFEGQAVKVILIDRSNHHLFQPLLYQVATAGLAPADIAQPIRSILRDQENASVVLDEVTAIKTATREVVTPDITFKYDYLIVAAGARHSYFGHDEWEPFAPGMKSLEDAVEIRRRILVGFEVAEKALSDEERKAALTFVVVGAGPTGVEMAGAIAELARFTLKKDFRRINPADAHVMLVEAGPRVLPPFSPVSSERTVAQLKALGVDVRTGCAVTQIAEGEAVIGGEHIKTNTIIWAAGNKASPLAGMLGAELDRQGRVTVNPDLSVNGHPEVFAVGDMAFATFKGGKPVPGVSPAALQGGRHAAQNILRLIKGEKTQKWEYFDKGSMATIGRHSAVAEVGPLKLSGISAWLGWAFVHLFFLIGFKSRIMVFFEWAWAYFTYSKGSRLISTAPGKWGVLRDPKKS